MPPLLLNVFKNTNKTLHFYNISFKCMYYLYNCVDAYVYI